MRQYIQECLGKDPYSIPRAGYAKDIFKNFKPNKDFTKVLNTPTGVPSKGDIIFWDFRIPITGIAGHVAVFTGGNAYKFISFDQNYPSKSPCRYYNHDYRGVMGWLHPLK
jgi:hypothetical protein